MNRSFFALWSLLLSVCACTGHAQESQIDLLEAELAEVRAQAIRDIVQDVLAEADTRTSLQTSGMISGWDKNFQIASVDGSFRLKMKGRVQVRWVLNHAQEQSTEWGFEQRRVELQFEGNVVDPSLHYGIKFAFSRSTGRGRLEDAFVKKVFDNGFALKVGAFKAPWMREELISSGRQLTAERSLVNGYFSQQYSKGIDLSWSDDDWRLRGWYGDGIASRGLGYGSQFNSTWQTDRTRWAFAGRAEYKFVGTWKQFKDFSSVRGEEFAAMLGVSVMGQKFIGGGTAADPLYSQGTGALQSGVTADLTLDFGGASLYVAGVFQNDRVANAAGSVETRTPWGAIIQGGVFITDHHELFARYSYLDASVVSGTGDPTTFNGCTVGMTWFILGHTLKFVTDCSINFATFGRYAPSGAGWRSDEPDADNQWAIRAQVQLDF